MQKLQEIQGADILYLMPYIIAGLGNPEGTLPNPKENYEETRHNTGRMFVRWFAEAEELPKFERDKKLKALISRGKIGAEKILAILPDDYMNNSGRSLAPLVKTKKQARETIVVYDDLDLPFGAFKISFNRGDGGHRGLASAIKSLKTREFVRIRIGISPSTPKGRTKKPSGEEKVLKFILGKYTKEEIAALKKLSKKVNQALETIIAEGREKAMGEWNY